MNQVSEQHYDFHRYVGLDRWSSYFYQLREIYASGPRTMLEVGVGDSTVRDHVARRGIAYTSLDIADDLNPDIIGSVDAMPCPDKSFDLVCAFEVLEHLSFEKFDTALAELARVSKGRVLISLPHFGPPVQFHVKLPLVRLRLAFKIPVPFSHHFNGEHYWEIGKRGYSARRIRTALAKHFVIQKEYVPYENQYHRFFVLEKKDGSP